MMARIRFFLPVIVLVVAILIVKGLLALREEPVIVPPEPRHPLVEVIVATPVDYTHTVTAHGEVAPLGVIDLVPEVGGRVVALSPSFRTGAFVAAEEVLIEIDRVDFERRVVIARSALREAELARETEAAQGEVAREEWETLAIGEASPLALREPQLGLAEARVDAARAQLEMAERDLARTQIEAPFDGRVWSKRADLGQVLAPGISIAQLARTDRVEVILPIIDADLEYLDVPLFPSEDGSFAGPEVTLRARFAGAERSWRGQVRRVEGSLDPETRMVRLVAEVEDPFRPTEDREVPLSPGLYVEAEIAGRRSSGVFVLPRTAWYEGEHLLIVDREGRVSMRTPVIERLERETIVVSGGVSAGERVIVTPLEIAVDGMRVVVGTGETP